MTKTDFLAAEQSSLVTTLRKSGPDAPTLCEDWNTRLLLAHLVRRERSIVEVGGRVNLPIVTKAAADALAKYAEMRSYETMLRAFAAGPPIYSPFAIKPLREAVNLLEYLIHHEDVRRGGPAGAEVAPRELDDEFQAEILLRLRSFAKLALRSAAVPALLISPDGSTIRVGKGDPLVTVSGAPVEIALVAFGRARAAHVEYSGEPADVAAFTKTPMGV